MTDGRHAPDTFFLVAESDFRFYRSHCVSNRNWLAEVDEFVEKNLKTASSVDAREMLNPAVPPEEEPITPTTDDELGGWKEPEEMRVKSESEPDWGESDAETEPDARQEATKKEKGKEKASWWGFTPGRRYEGSEAYVCEELQDLVRIATVAHRRGMGDVVWYSWVGGGKKRRTVPSHGSTLVGISKEGAFKLLEAIMKEKNPCTSTSGSAISACTTAAACGHRMCCPRSATTMSTSAAATPPTQAILLDCALRNGTTTGAWKAFALKGQMRNTKIAVCAPLSKKALIGASR